MVRERLRTWLLTDITDQPAGHLGPHRQATRVEHTHSWWAAMCLTGVDYFSTLAYQPAIAVAAAGALAPAATSVLVAVTLFGALPVYRRVARESPGGEGSIAMLEHLLPRWGGKLFVVALLGFAATDFVITITLSTADAAAHISENPFAPASLTGHQVVITLLLVAMLTGVFLRGFTEAIAVAVVLVTVFLFLNLVVVVTGLWHIAATPSAITAWRANLLAEHSDPLIMVGVAVLVFPKLALGLSGFETGVTVMPQIKGSPADTPARPDGRIRGAHRLLGTAAVIMSGLLLSSSVVATLLIPREEFDTGGQANGRAIAYLAHDYLGDGFGTIYDLSTIAILWFAGASALAGLLNLVPRFLPRYGMAPEWARAVRPLVLVIAGTAVVITLVFGASVEAQSGAYATGVLVLMTSATVAVTLSARRQRHHRQQVMFVAIAAVFAYTTITNVIERPEGLQVAAWFIAAIVAVSLLSRIHRAFELRATSITFDPLAAALIARQASSGVIDIITHDPDRIDPLEYDNKLSRQCANSHLDAARPILFLEVNVTDASDFAADLNVHGCYRGRHRVLSVSSAAIPNAIAAVLLHIRDTTDIVPNVYFEWSEGNLFTNLVRFLVFGVGEVASVTREVLRRNEPDSIRRPRVHVG